MPQDTQMTQEQLVERYGYLTKKREALNAKRIELSTTFNHHKEEYRKCMETLKTEFKVNSLEEAYALRDRLQAEATKEMDELTRLLSEFDDILEKGGEGDVPVEAQEDQ